METEINKVIKEVYDKCNLVISDFLIEDESKDYNACQFKLNGKKIIFRTGKTTPKKSGQFVTFWIRNKQHIIEPYNDNSNFDFFVINVLYNSEWGQFVFPKSELVKQKILSTKTKDGKRGFRIYTPWDIALNKQAQKTKEWQIKFFYKIDNLTDFNNVKSLYNIEKI